MHRSKSAPAIHYLALSEQAALSGTAIPLVMLDRNQGRPADVHRQYLEQYMHHWCVGLVEHRVIDVASFEEEVARSVNNRLFRQDISHVAGCHLSDARTDMIVLADIPTGRERQLGDPKLVLAIDLDEEPADRGFELNLG